MTSTPDGRLIAGRFRLLSELGAGGFGQVLKAEDLHANGALRAVKTLKRDLNVQDLAQRFKEEAQALTSLKHVGVPKCWDFGEDEHFGLYLVLDYIEGETLLDSVEKSGMPWRVGSRGRSSFGTS